MRAVLSRLAAFRGPVDYEAAKAVTSFKKERMLRDALRELVERGLLFFDRAAVHYDLHPIVRRYAYDRLRDKGGIHTRLQTYFGAVPRPAKVETLDDLAPTIELYHHTVRAGRYDEARALLRDRLDKPLYYGFGAYETYIELLRVLFPDGEDKPPRLSSDRDQAWTVDGLAHSYARSGQPCRALPLRRLSNAMRDGGGDNELLPVGLVNLADDQLEVGDLAAAESNVCRGLALGGEVRDESVRGVARRTLGLLLAFEGAFPRAGAELDAAYARFGKLRQPFSQCIVEMYRALRALLAGNGTEALEAARRAREGVDRAARTDILQERASVWVEWLLGWSHVALGAERAYEREHHLAGGGRHLTEALTRCRQMNLVEFEPDILLAWARWHRLKGNPDEARRQAKDALYIADRCEYRLCQADIHNFLARLDLEAGNPAGARRHAETARERAECDGPPHYYKPAYEEAERLLAELGA